MSFILPFLGVLARLKSTITLKKGVQKALTLEFYHDVVSSRASLYPLDVSTCTVSIAAARSQLDEATVKQLIAASVPDTVFSNSVTQKSSSR
jgi:hypothetical protein